MVGGIFGVGRLATKLKGLADTEHIGPWHIGQWADFKHTAIRMRFASIADGERAKGTSSAPEFASVLMTAHAVLGGPTGCSQTVSAGAWVFTTGCGRPTAGTP